MLKWYENLRIGFKIIIGFLIVALIAGIIGGVGIISIERVEGSYRTAFQDTAEALESLEKISAANQRIRANLYKLLASETRSEKQEAVDGMSRADADLKEGIEGYWRVLENYDAADIIEENALLNELESDTTAYRQKRDEFTNEIAMNPERRAEALAYLNGKIAPLREEVDSDVQGLVEYNNAYAEKLIVSNDRVVITAEIIMVVCIVVGVLLAILIGTYLARSLSRRIARLVEVMGKLSKGDFEMKISLDSQDEIGVLSKAAHDMSATVKTIIQDLGGGLGAFSSGNFAVASNLEHYYINGYRPLFDGMLVLRDSLSDTLRSIHSAAEQVAIGSDQVSGGAQALAAGSTEQAASVEELSATVEHIAEQAQGNSAMIAAASKSIQKSDEGVTAGNQHMEQLTQAMAEIGSSSNQIANITKLIEDIAFQTNILSLNAAIEAARAGNAGKGFAVVAEEVRTLAARSGEAAKQTAELIEHSVATVAKGTEITGQTAQILRDVGASAVEVTESFGRIEQSIQKQTVAFEQIREGLSQISSVVQTNAATAEENSATSEEMAAQAAMLRQEVERFRLWEGDQPSPHKADDASGESGMLLPGADFRKKALSSGINLGKY
ncbi:methyl-accepting chemotaxis protein [Anaerotaenia torta]|uniref:methyl-accepting chemotaxis protein n=1 Tax=Anaerotaenia torta TaxID=433293 RepID=UPI003D1B243A